MKERNVDEESVPAGKRIARGGAQYNSQRSGAYLAVFLENSQDAILRNLLGGEGVNRGP